MRNCNDYTKAIAYYRVSTHKQGQSGLGLAAQRASVEEFAAARNLALIGEFTEIETGTSKRRRVEIFEAIEAAKANDAILLIAKLDRLARNVAFVSALQESGACFVAVDMPDVDNFTIHILAAVAEREAKLISQRTKAALDAKLERDGEWRVSNLDDAARAVGQEANRAAAQRDYQKTMLPASMMRAAGLSYGKIADKLNEAGYRTRTGKTFKAMTVKRMLDRAESAEVVESVG